MNATQQEVNQTIRARMTQIQADLEIVLEKIFEQAGSRIKPEIQEKVREEIECTKQILECFKSKYSNPI